MRIIPAGLISYLAAKPRPLARISRLELITGDAFHFTEHDRSLKIGSQIYLASHAVETQAIECSTGDIAVNSDVTINYVDGLTKELAAGGYYDNAKIKIDVCAWPDPNAGTFNLFTGTVQQKNINDKSYGSFTIKGLSREIDGFVVELYSQECRANLGDNRCKVPLGPHTFNFTVNAIDVDRRIFDATIVGTLPTGDFDFGRLRFTGDTYDMEIGKHTNLGANLHKIQLLIPRINPITVSMTGDITRGCNKTLTRCMFFDNVVNRRAEDYIPGPDTVIQVIK